MHHRDGRLERWIAEVRVELADLVRDSAEAHDAVAQLIQSAARESSLSGATWDADFKERIALRLEDGVPQGTVYVPAYYDGGAIMSLFPLEGAGDAQPIRVRVVQLLVAHQRGQPPPGIATRHRDVADVLQLAIARRREVDGCAVAGRSGDRHRAARL